MIQFITKNLIPLVSALILIIYLGLYVFAETWVFRTLPYKAEVSTIDFNQSSRKFFGTILKPDSYYQTALMALRNDDPHPDVVLINLDGDLIAEQNTWPLARKVHADVFRTLAAMQPRAVLIDMIFEWPQAPWVLESLGKHISDMPQQTYLKLVRELNFDGQLKRSLSKLNYALIYILARKSEFANEQQRKQYAANMVRIVSQSKVEIEGQGEIEVFPYQRIQGVRTSILPLQLRAKGQGFAWVNNDRYGTISSAPLFHRLQTTGEKPKSYYLMNAISEAARIYTKEKSYKLTLNNGKAEKLRVGEHEIHTDPAGEIQINFYNRQYESRIPQYRAHDLINGKIALDAIKGKVVIFGSDSNLLHDYHNTPVGKIWGTELVAYGVSNILNGDSFYKPAWAPWLEIPILIILFTLVMLAVTRLKPMQSLAIVLGLTALLFLYVSTFFVQWGMTFSIIVPVSFIAILYAQSTTMRFIIDERQKRLYKSALGLYLSPQLAEQVSENPELLSLKGAEEDLTVLFSDIRGFTTISESMEAEALTEFLHEYFSPMTDIVFDKDGTLDKYIGDAIMAFWGAPLPQENHAALATEASLLMLERLDELRVGWLERGLPSVQIGIGLNSGIMRVGNMGSDRRLSYTLIGDNVNLGARLEGLTKYYGVRLILSESTWLSVNDLFYGRELDRVVVKGKELAVPIHEVIGRGEPDAEMGKDLADWEKALANYRDRDWDSAEPVFKYWYDKYDENLTADMYLKLIAEFRINPPPDDWQAVNVMTTK
ncbi:MAG: adenylate/guanylate cyclase domain-containing protein [Sulfuriflexus sp.]|nr:adenylate/guanylate cyclase domain-containing protein [Sulfuriflexus sp.]